MVVISEVGEELRATKFFYKGPDNKTDSKYLRFCRSLGLPWWLRG